MSAADTVVALTGATSGIGRAAARLLADHGATVVAVGRDRERGVALEVETADAAGDVAFVRADLADLAAVRALADDLRAHGPDVLAHNAGASFAERTETPDGLEATLAVNHLAPYLLTHELLDDLRAAGTPDDPARVVVTASGLHRRGTLDVENLQFERGYDPMDAYARSKLANVAFTLELADRLGERVVANCFHPGFVPSTNLFRNARLRTRLLMRALAAVPGVGTDAEAGARRLVRLATAPAFGDRSGLYAGGDGVETPAEAARDPAVRRRLWERSAALVGVDPDWPS